MCDRLKSIEKWRRGKFDEEDRSRVNRGNKHFSVLYRMRR
jgi:hypothetical protein